MSGLQLKLPVFNKLKAYSFWSSSGTEPGHSPPNAESAPSLTRYIEFVSKPSRVKEVYYHVKRAVLLEPVKIAVLQLRRIVHIGGNELRISILHAALCIALSEYSFERNRVTRLSVAMPLIGMGAMSWTWINGALCQPVYKHPPPYGDNLMSIPLRTLEGERAGNCRQVEGVLVRDS